MGGAGPDRHHGCPDPRALTRKSGKGFAVAAEHLCHRFEPGSASTAQRCGRIDRRGRLDRDGIPCVDGLANLLVIRRGQGLTGNEIRRVLAAVDAHTIHALAAADGRELWRFHAGGRVDSPPTLHAGMAVFSCADGHVYALRLADGELAWRFQVAPSRRKIISYGQLDSRASGRCTKAY